MTNKTERELDLENLQQLQRAGKIDQDVNLKELAHDLLLWRKSNDLSDKINLANYGRDCDLDNLVLTLDTNEDAWRVRAAVAKRGRSQDLDILVNDPNHWVRMVVAWQKRDKDLDKLARDPDADVRIAVAWQRRPQDLDILTRDPDEGVRANVAWQGRPQDLAILINDKNQTVSDIAAFRK